MTRRVVDQFLKRRALASSQSMLMPNRQRKIDIFVVDLHVEKNNGIAEMNAPSYKSLFTGTQPNTQS
jgi:hypothetical protein